MKHPSERAQQIWASALYLKNTYGLNISYAVIYNEPTIASSILADDIKALAPRLAAHGLTTWAQYAEAVAPQNDWNYVTLVLNDPDLWPCVGRISYHNYGAADPYRSYLRDCAQSRGLTTAQTEMVDPSFDDLYNDLIVGGVTYWEVAYSSGNTLNGFVLRHAFAGEIPQNRAGYERGRDNLASVTPSRRWSVASILGTYICVSAGRCEAIFSKLVALYFVSNPRTRPSPTLYAARASGQSWNWPCRYIKYFAAAAAHFSGCNRSSCGRSDRPSDCAVRGMSWNKPAAPTGLRAAGSKDDSTSASHTSSFGTCCAANTVFRRAA